MPTLPNTIPTDAALRGVRVEIDGYVAQNVNITRSPQRQEYADQNGAIRGGAEYDARYEFSATVYATGASTASPFDGKDRVAIAIDGTTNCWALDSVQEAGTYNDVTRWTVSAHRFLNWPTAEKNALAAASAT